jgi:hypothetical protein
MMYLLLPFSDCCFNRKCLQDYVLSYRSNWRNFHCGNRNSGACLLQLSVFGDVSMVLICAYDSSQTTTCLEVDA